MPEIEYITTIYDGEVRDDLRFDVSSSEIVRFSIHDIAAYAPIVAHISHVFCRAELLAEELFLNEPLKVTFVLEGAAESKYKTEDSETKLQRILWFLMNAAQPKNGIIIQVFINHKMKYFLDSPFSFTSLWHSKSVHQKKDSNYITLHPHVEIDWNAGKSSHRREGTKEQIQLTRDICSSLGFDVVEIDYTTPLEKAHKLLLGAKCHIGYIGSVHYLAAFNRTPCVTLGKWVPGVKENPLGLTRTRHYDHLAPEYELDFNRMRVWNQLGAPPGRTLIYNFDSQHMYQDEPRYYTMADPSDMIQSEEVIKRALL